jgi:G3E family GTPase
MNRRLPLTLVGGFPGSGKTSLLHSFISEHRGGNLAVLVENPGAINLDARAVRGLCGAMRRLYDTVLEIPSGDEEAQIEWIAERLREFSLAGRYERVLIEVSGTANAARLGRQFGLLPGQPEIFAPWATLHQVVCVVDALDFYREVVAPGRNDSPGSLADLQQAQIEGASLLVLNKCDLVTDAERTACARLMCRINPEAPFVETAYGEVPTEVWSRSGTAQELGLALERGLRPTPEGDDAREVEPPLSELGSSLYRAYRPFHPARFRDWLDAEHPGLLRVKGLVWLATRNLLVGGVSRTRWQNGCGAAGVWWAALPREEWPEDAGTLLRMQETWREPYGDRRQELVLMGDPARVADTVRRLNACLLTAEEYGRPASEWLSLPDPFPVWDLGGEG